MTGQTTQSRHPWRATTRTVTAAVLALLPVLPEIASQLGVATYPVVASVLVVVGGVTRVLAMPAVNSWLHTYSPWLAADPAPPQTQPKTPAFQTRWPDGTGKGD